MARFRTYPRMVVLACVAAAAIAGAALAPFARAHDYTQGDIMIGHLWSPPGQDGPVFVYGPFLNRGDAPDWLVAAASPLADGIAFCVSPEKGGGCAPAIALAPGKPYAMAPWRPAIRLSGVARAPEKGEAFPLTLTFEKAGKVAVEVVVETASGH